MTTNAITIYGGLTVSNLTVTGTFAASSSDFGGATFVSVTSTNVTSTNIYVTNAGLINATTTNIYTTNGNIQNLTFNGATGNNANITTITGTNVTSTNINATSLTFTTAVGTSVTSTNVDATSLTYTTAVGTNTTSTSLFTNNLGFLGATGTGLTITGTLESASTTVTTLNFTNATGANLYVTNFSAGTFTATNITWTNATGTNTTSTNLYASNLGFLGATGTGLSITGTLSSASTTVTTLNFNSATGATLNLSGAFAAGSSTVSTLNFISATGSSLYLPYLTAINALFTNTTATSLNVSGLSQFGNVILTNATGTTLNLVGAFNAGSSTVTTLNFTNATGTSLFANSGIFSNLSATAFNAADATITSVTATNIGVTSLLVGGLQVCLSDGTHCQTVAGGTQTLQSVSNIGSYTTTTLTLYGGLVTSNITATGTIAASSSDMGNLTWANATGTNTTSTNLFATLIGFANAAGSSVSSTNLYVNTQARLPSDTLIGGAIVCLQTGVGCPPSGSGGDSVWADVATGYLYPATSSRSVAIGSSATTTAPFVFDMNGAYPLLTIGKGSTAGLEVSGSSTVRELNFTNATGTNLYSTNLHVGGKEVCLQDGVNCQGSIIGGSLGLHAASVVWTDETHIVATYDWTDANQLLDWTPTTGATLARGTSTVAITGGSTDIRGMRWILPIAASEVRARAAELTSDNLQISTNLSPSWVGSPWNANPQLSHAWLRPPQSNAGEWVVDGVYTDYAKEFNIAPNAWNDFIFQVTPTALRSWVSSEGNWYELAGSYAPTTTGIVAVGAYGASSGWGTVVITGEISSSTYSGAPAFAIGGLTFTNASGTMLSLSGSLAAASTTVTTLNFTNATGSNLYVTNFSAGTFTATNITWTNATGTNTTSTNLYASNLGFLGATGTGLSITGTLSSASTTVTTLNFTSATGSSLYASRTYVDLLSSTGTFLTVSSTSITLNGRVDAYGLNRWFQDPMTARPILGRAATTTVGTTPWGIAFDGAYMWVANLDGGNVSKIDVLTNTVVATVTVGVAPRGVVYDGQYIWVANSGSRYLSKIDPRTNTVVQNVTTQTGPYSLAFDGTYIWATYETGAYTVSKISTTSSSMIKTLSIGGASDYVQGVAFDGTNVWVGRGWIPGVVNRIDPNTDLVTGTSTTPGSYFPGAFDGSYLWVDGYENNVVYKVDVRTTAVVAT
ncbi:MAG: hypothetical protein WC895_04725, partial [Candidatus Shapirobacteria bacterium]